jgi:endonuclease YncB( thermonuclease family)
VSVLHHIGIVCWLVGLCAPAYAAATGAPAQAPVTATTACQFEALATGKVAKVLDGRSFVLEDGREVRIAGIEVPPAPQPGETGARVTAGVNAKAALEAILAGATVALRGEHSALDRYGRTVAYVEVVGTGLPVAHDLVSKGHARVAALVGPAACAAELLARERGARKAKLGLWADPYYVVVAAGNGAELLALLGYFTIVEGRVLSVRESGGTIYLNFGRRWSRALTVTISKPHERIFLGAGLSPRRLENRVIRVRGWIDERNGPRIEATRPEQIEMADLN